MLLFGAHGHCHHSTHSGGRDGERGRSARAINGRLPARADPVVRAHTFVILHRRTT